ncbi:hypothetical protein VC83_03392 [Pseudogymnoascus destructans]|uniref:Uncharacterized protein n=2 Tax=Pseudogymnoascus destructans TaxID=655981 RepID=L8FUU4_PSED2|nr:uncharacterized protein VC83_03392 [Pseudogymnoascus destructans]ELR03516.1 hypothetical protein GMDG_01267 [Pseudogymnoascus destructans 20631-21]OAF60659.1 hypothetical protein VC83_03392 [Pseudogymnoascus destructans]
MTDLDDLGDKDDKATRTTRQGCDVDATWMRPCDGRIHITPSFILQPPTPNTTHPIFTHHAHILGAKQPRNYAMAGNRRCNNSCLTPPILTLTLTLLTLTLISLYWAGPALRREAVALTHTAAGLNKANQPNNIFSSLIYLPLDELGGDLYVSTKRGLFIHIFNVFLTTARHDERSARTR